MTPRAYRRRCRRTARRTEKPPNYSEWARECSGYGCPCCDPGMVAEKGGVLFCGTIGEDMYWHRRYHYEELRDANRAARLWEIKPWTAIPYDEVEA